MEIEDFASTFYKYYQDVAFRPNCTPRGHCLLFIDGDWQRCDTSTPEGKEMFGDFLKAHGVDPDDTNNKT